MAKRRPVFLVFTGFVGLLILVAGGGYVAWTQLGISNQPAESFGESLNKAKPSKEAVAAMLAVFPGADPATGAVKGADAEGAKELNAANAVSRPLLTAGSRDKPILITVTEEADACHACSGSLSVYYLKRVGGALAAEQAFPHFLGGDGFGAAGDLRRIRLKSGKVAFSYSTGFTGQGYSCGMVDVFSLESDHPALLLQSEPTYYDDSGAKTDGSAVTIEGNISKQPKAHDLEITFTGGDAPGSAGFDLDGEALKLTSGKSLDRTC